MFYQEYCNKLRNPCCFECNKLKVQSISPHNLRNSGLSGGDIPQEAEERRNEVATDVTDVYQHGIIAGDTLEPETRGALETMMGKPGRTKRKEQEREIYVQLSEDNSDQEPMTRKHRQLSRRPPTLEHIEKVNVISIRIMQV